MQKPLISMIAAICALLVIPTEALAQRKRKEGKEELIKIATLAPEGTSWFNVLTDLDRDLKESTGGELGLRIYGGGVQGDEKLVLRKIKLGQLQAAGFTGIGLGEIVPSIRLLELPFTYESPEEVDYVRSKLESRLKAAFEAQGFVVIGWVDVGFAFMYSNRKVHTVEDLRKAKPWVWEGDPLAGAAFEHVGVKPTPLTLPDVLTSLSTGLIDTVYTSPNACVGLQWWSKVKYVNDLPLAHGTGGLLLQRSYFDGLDEKKRASLLELGDKHGKRLTAITRAEDTQAAKTLTEKGIETIPFDKTQSEELKKIGAGVCDSLCGKLYSKEELAEVRAWIAEYRAQKPKQ